MWSNKKPWWAKKAEENKADKPRYKNWCVIKIATGCAVVNGGYTFTYKYKAVARENAPHRYGKNGRLEAEVEVDNLTKQTAHEVAKGLNFLDGESNGNTK